DIDLVAVARARGAQRRLQLLLCRCVADDAKAAVGAEDAVPAPPRAGPVDQVVDELVRRPRLLLLGAELEQRPPQLLDALARRGRDPEDADDPVVIERPLRRLAQEIGLVQDDRLRAALQPGAVLGELVVDRAEPAL